MTQGKMTPWHCHPETEELSYLIEGECLVKVGDEERHVTAGGTS